MSCFWFLALGAGGLGASCGGDGDGGASICDSFDNHMRECGLLSAGASACDVPEDQREGASCALDCLSQIDCTTLSTFFCATDVPNTPSAVSFNDCVLQCAEQFGFHCANPQDGPVAVRSDFVCDGSADCADGSDEAGCEQFECGSGEQVPASWFCDGAPDCSDGSDEAAPCEHFSCADGSEVPASFHCDAFDDCADGSDEAGCGRAKLQCQ
jgi:hypothetical protein